MKIPLRLCVGTRNEMKADAVRRAARACFGTCCLVNRAEVVMSTHGTPVSDAQAIAAARERARQAFAGGACEVAVGVEASVRSAADGVFMTCWAVVTYGAGTESIGAGPQLLLPSSLHTDAGRGIDVRDILSKISPEFGSDPQLSPIDFLTGGVFTRSEMLQTAALMALAPVARAIADRESDSAPTRREGTGKESEEGGNEDPP